MRIVMHGHHADTLFSYYEDEAAVAARIRFIETDKPEGERALRLALLKDVTELLPRTKAWVAFEKARAASVKAGAAYQKAWDAYLASFDTEAFHREHCHSRCPWNGQSIFPKGTGIEVLDE